MITASTSQIGQRNVYVMCPYCIHYNMLYFVKKILLSVCLYIFVCVHVCLSCSTECYSLKLNNTCVFVCVCSVVTYWASSDS